MHQWIRTTAHDNHHNDFHAYICEVCNYLVVAYPPTEEEQHFPEHRLIVLPQTDLTEEDAVSAAERFGAECDD